MYSGILERYKYLFENPQSAAVPAINNVVHFLNQAEHFKIVDFHNRSYDDKVHSIQRVYQEKLDFEHAASTAGVINPFFDDFKRVKTSHYSRRLKDVAQFQLGDDRGLQTRGSHVTHVELIAREIAIGMNLSRESETLAATIASIHDLGHPPFAHDGEEAFNRILQKHGEADNKIWDHDMMGLRIVTEMANIGLSFPGMNLCLDVLEGLAKRYWRFSNDPQKRAADPKFLRDPAMLPAEFRRITAHADMKLEKHNHLEGQIASIADWIAFTATDIEDGLKVGIYRFKDLNVYCPALAEVWKNMRDEYAVYMQAGRTERQKAIGGKKYDLEKDLEISVRNSTSLKQARDNRLSSFIHSFRRVIEAQLINDVLEQTAKNVDGARKNGTLKNADDVRNLDHLLVNFSPAMTKSLLHFQDHCKDSSWPEVRNRFGFNPGVMVERLFYDIFDGKLTMEGTWDERYKELRPRMDRGDKLAESMLAQSVCEYITIFYTDKPVETHIREHHPDLAKLMKKTSGRSNRAPAFFDEEDHARRLKWADRGATNLGTLNYTDRIR